MDDLIERAFDRFAHLPLLVAPHGTSTYRVVRDDAQSLRAALHDTIGPQGSCAVLLENGPDHFTTLLGLGLAGCTRVSLSAADPLEHHARRIRDTGARALVTTNETWNALQALNAQFPSLSTVITRGAGLSDWTVATLRSGGAATPDGGIEAGPRPYQLSFTGGTTGAPKPVFLSPRAIRTMVAQLWLDVVQPSPGDVFCAATPISHASGTFLLPFFLRGAALAWQPSFSAEDLVDAVDAGYLCDFRTTTFLVPTAIDSLLKAAADHRARRSSRQWFDTIVYGAAPAWPQLIDHARARFGDCLVQIYGQTEAPMTITVLPRSEHAVFGTRIGVPVGRPCSLTSVWVERDGREAAVDEIGEVCVTGDVVMRGYLDHPDETRDKMPRYSTIRTSDLGYFASDGILWLVDRARDMIVSGGYNVFPTVVERVLRDVDGVADVLVTGAPHPRWGEAVVAGVTIEPDHSWDAVVERAEGAAKARLAMYERPKLLQQLATIPRTSLDKPDRAAFRDTVVDAFGAAAMWSRDSPTPTESNTPSGNEGSTP